MKRLLITLTVLALSAPALADEPQAAYKLERGASPHAGLPFNLLLLGVGFDETPPPEQPKLAIPGAKLTPLGAQPNVQRSVQIINGRRTDATQVTWVFRWRVEVAKEGRVEVPSTTIVQGGKRATAQAADLEVDSVPSTDDMKLTLELPDRPVFVGETVPVKLVWMFRRQPEDQSFTVPLASMEDFTVSAPPIVDRRRAIELQAGAKTLELPYDIDATDVGGQKWNRVTLHLFVAPRNVGKVEVPASSVVAGMPTSRADFFGNVQTKLFRAADVPHTLEVKPLPETDRPPSFVGAVGSQFSIQVGTSRSVVQLGEPVELAITVKSDERLDALALGRLDHEGGLPKDKFTVPDEQSTGELSEDGKTKTFKITAQVIGPTTEIPAIAFSYFDPVKGTYQTIHSDPIAVSVKGGSVVGANDVIAMASSKKAGAQQAPSELSLVNVRTSRCRRRAMPVAGSMADSCGCSSACSTPCRSPCSASGSGRSARARSDERPPAYAMRASASSTSSRELLVIPRATPRDRSPPRSVSSRAPPNASWHRMTKLCSRDSRPRASHRRPRARRCRRSCAPVSRRSSSDGRSRSRRRVRRASRDPARCSCAGGCRDAGVGTRRRATPRSTNGGSHCLSRCDDDEGRVGAQGGVHARGRGARRCSARHARRAGAARGLGQFAALGALVTSGPPHSRTVGRSPSTAATCALAATSGGCARNKRSISDRARAAPRTRCSSSTTGRDRAGCSSAHSHLRSWCCCSSRGPVRGSAGSS